MAALPPDRTPSLVRSLLPFLPKGELLFEARVSEILEVPAQEGLSVFHALIVSKRSDLLQDVIEEKVGLHFSYLHLELFRQKAAERGRNLANGLFAQFDRH